jgi:hypothetical protein
VRYIEDMPVILWFFIAYATYIIIACWVMLAGYMRELTGWHYAGRPGRMHVLLFQLHTGRHINTARTYGDDRRLNRTAASTNKATPEGQIVYWHPWKRWQRCIRNNVIVFVVISAVVGLFVDTPAALSAITVAIVFLILLGISTAIHAARKRIMAKRPVRDAQPKTKPAMAATRKAKNVMAGDATTIGTTANPVAESRPTLTSDVPITVVAGLLADAMGCSSAELQSRLTLTSTNGQVRLPDRFAALEKQRDPVEEIIRAHTEGRVAFSWKTTTNPRMLVWKPVTTGLPAQVLFRDYQPLVDACKPGVFAVGLTENKTVYYADHNGDTPWHCTSAGSGTGKSTRFLVKAAQAAHNDPTSDIYCIDTKQISFVHLHGIPGIYVFDDPQGDMPGIWNVFYTLEGIMRDRYAAVREGRMTLDQFNNMWVFVDEGNDLSGHLKAYWNKRLKKSGDASQPVIWGEAIGPLLRLGRQAKIRGEFMLQDVTDRALGGESLKMAFSVFGMADWKKSQWDRIVGPPAPPVIRGPGKIMMVRGTSQDWVQGFWDDPEYLRAYALENRRGRQENVA